MKYTLLCFFLTVFPLFAVPEVATLSNGLTVVTEEMGYTRSVAVVIQYRVGARNETDDLAGISHFTEHMLFNGTPSMPSTTFWQIVKKNGGNANGGTGQDQTTYYLNFPADRLAEALAIESDRMRNCPMDSATVAEEIGVVLDEWRLGQDSPDQAIWQAMSEIMHPAHPYRRPVIGYGETISAFTAGAVRYYYNSWYQPGNAVLVIAGDIDPREAMELAEEYFGGIPEGYAPELRLPGDPPLEGPVRKEIVFPAESARLMIGFQGPEQTSPDMPALDFIAAYLSAGRTSWLENSLVLPGLASSAWASAPGSIDPSPFIIAAVLQEGADPDSVERMILVELERLSTTLLDEETMTGIKQRFAADEILSSDNPVGVAWRRAYYWNLAGDPMYHEKYLESFSALTPEDVRDAADRYFSRENRATVVLVPGGGTPASETGGDIHRELAPPDDMDWEGLIVHPEDLAPPEESVSEGVARFTLENGLTLLVREDHTFPIVEIAFSFPMGDRRNPPELAGLAALTVETMLGGTEALDRPSFHRRLEDLGAGIWIGAGDVFSWGSVWGLSRDAEVLILSAADVLVRPAMRPGDFEAARSRAAGWVRTSLEEPLGMVFSRAAGTIETEASARIVTEETLNRITDSDVRECRRICVRPSETVIAVVGDITPERALEMAELNFSGWSEPEEDLPSPEEYGFREVPGDTAAVSIPGRIQAAAAVMCPAPGLNSPDEPAFDMASRILGSGISSRLGRYIREQQGLAYAVWGYSDAQYTGLGSTAVFTAAYATGAPMNTRALRSVQNECERLAREGVEEIELRVEQSRSMGAHALNFDTYGDLAEYLARVESMGLPLDWDLRRLRLVAELEPEDVRSAAGRYFTGRWFVFSAGGIGENLEPIAGSSSGGSAAGEVSPVP